jgi:hypothetical protein
MMGRPLGSKNGVRTVDVKQRHREYNRKRYAEDHAFRERASAASKAWRLAHPYKRTTIGWGENSEIKRAASRRKWVENNRPARKENKVNQRDNIRALRDSFKMAGCSLCGYSKCLAAIEFHHVSDDKEHLVGRSSTLLKLRQEAAKCIVICANCHREIHAGQIEGYENVQRAVPEQEEPPLLRVMNGS